MQEQLTQLKSYIIQQLGQGAPEPAVYQALIQSGWPQALVEQAFAAVRASQPQPAVPPSPLQPPAQQQPTAQSAFQQSQQPSQQQWQQPQHDEVQLQASAGPAAVPKYGVFRGIGDVFRAIRNNPAGFLVALAASFLISFVTIFVLSRIFGLIPAVSLAGLIGGLAQPMLAYVLVGAVEVTAISLVIMDGIEKRTTQPVEVFRQTIRRFSRVFLANLLFGLVVTWPLFVLFFGSILAIGLNNIFLFMAIFSLFAFIWVLITYFRFALAPVVALFEPDLPIGKILSRSKQLMASRGQNFLFIWLVLSAILVALIASISGMSFSQFFDSDSALSSSVLIAIGIMGNAMLCLLYRNQSRLKT